MGSSREDAEEAVGCAGPVWAEVSEDILRGYLQREKVVTRRHRMQSYGQIRLFRPAEKKHKIKGGGRKAPTSRSQRPATRAVSKACGISPLHRPGWSVSGIFKFKVVGRAKNPAFPSGCAVSGLGRGFLPLKVRSLRRYIKEKGWAKLSLGKFLIN